MTFKAGGRKRGGLRKDFQLKDGEDFAANAWY